MAKTFEEGRNHAGSDPAPFLSSDLTLKLVPPCVWCTHTPANTHTYTDTCSVTCLHTHTHTHTHWRTHSVAHIHTHTHTHTSKSSVHIRWSARTKTTYTQCNCDRIQLESKFAQGKERSVCLEIKGVAAIGERRKQREKQKKSNRQRERERESRKTERPKERGGRGQRCCATFRPGSKTRCTWGTD